MLEINLFEHFAGLIRDKKILRTPYLARKLDIFAFE